MNETEFEYFDVMRNNGLIHWARSKSFVVDFRNEGKGFDITVHVDGIQLLAYGMTAMYEPKEHEEFAVIMGEMVKYHKYLTERYEDYVESV